MIFAKQRVILLKLELVHGLHVVADLLVYVFLNCSAAVGHHGLRLVFAEVEVHRKGADQFVNQILDTFKGLWQQLRRLLDVFVLHVERLDILGHVLSNRILVTA